MTPERFKKTYDSLWLFCRGGDGNQVDELNEVFDYVQKLEAQLAEAQKDKELFKSNWDDLRTERDALAQWRIEALPYLNIKSKHCNELRERDIGSAMRGNDE